MTHEEPESNAASLKTQLAKNEQKLRNNEARFRTLIETIPLGLLIIDQSGVIESASPACLFLFRCAYSDFYHRHLRDFFVADEATISELMSLAPNQAKEVLARRNDGSEFPASFRLSPFALSSESSAPGLLVVIEDVSARHELEQLRHEFISMLTHDLRAPLSSVKCFLELVSEGVYDSKVSDLKSKSDEIGKETNRLINMINSLLDLHKLEAGKLKLVPQRVQVEPVLRQSVQAVDSWAESCAVPLIIDDMEDAVVEVDVDYTVRVLVNLLSNAVKFSPKGSPVTISVRPRDRFLKVMVRDKGKGIPKEHQSRLFNRFEQVELSDSRVKGGTGLGLAICKAIVEAQGGTIGVESEPDQGCTFWFTLPQPEPGTN